MKKIICILLVISILSVKSYGISAKSAALMDVDTGEVLYELNGDEVLPMASTTKIMTAIIAIENGDLDKEIKVKREYTLVEGSSMYLKDGEILKLKDIIYGLMLSSGNDAATAIAAECGGTEEFISKMNDKAKELGLNNTSFENPSGLDGENHHTSAKDLAKLTSYCLQNDTFAEIVGTKEYTIDERYLRNHNKLLWLYDGTIGVKTGFTKKSGRCLVTAAEKNGRRLVAVTLNDGNDWKDHISMFESGFANYKNYDLHKAQDTIKSVDVIGGDKKQVEIKTSNEFSLFLTDKEYQNLEKVVCGKKMIYAPVKSGEIYGTIKYSVNGKILCEDVLVFADSSNIDESQIKYNFFEKVINYLRSLV